MYRKNFKLIIKHVSGETPLHVACRNGNFTKVTKILEYENVDINSRDYNNWTPLHEAVSNGQLQCVNVLLSHKAATIESDIAYPIKRE